MSYDIVWKEGDEELFERFADLAFPKFDHIGAALVNKFSADVQLLPFEWPTSERHPSEHIWKIGPVRLRYLVIPAEQRVEVLSVKQDAAEVS